MKEPMILLHGGRRMVIFVVGLVLSRASVLLVS